MDVFNKAKRRQIMSNVRNRNTTPEKQVRSCLHKMGYRFRLHRKDLPGTPDIVLPKYRTAVFVHGCFWHGHPGCKRAKRPSTQIEFWNRKLNKNIERDLKARRNLKLLGWKVFIVWECETRNADFLRTKLSSMLPLV